VGAPDGIDPHDDGVIESHLPSTDNLPTSTRRAM